MPTQEVTSIVSIQIPKPYFLSLSRAFRDVVIWRALKGKVPNDSYKVKEWTVALPQTQRNLLLDTVEILALVAYEMPDVSLDEEQLDLDYQALIESYKEDNTP